jgi:hypothetical protein
MVPNLLSRMRCGLLAAWVLVSIALAPAYATSGNHAFEFMRLPSEPVGRSLAGAHVATVDGPASLAWNPAGLGEGGAGVVLAHATWEAGTAWESGALALPIGAGACALSCSYFRSGALDGYDVNGTPTGSFESTQLWASLGYGTAICGRIRAGAGLEVALESGPAEERRAFAGCLGLQVDAGPVAFGLAALHLGPALVVDETEYALPAVVRAGVSVTAVRGTVLYAAGEWTVDEPLAMRLGAAWSPLSSLHFLAGTWIAPDESNSAVQPALGCAFDLGRTRIAYGLQPRTELAASHQISLTVALD